MAAGDETWGGCWRAKGGFFEQINSMVRKEMGQIPQKAQGEKVGGIRGSSWIGTPHH